jgi:hypothetical protein
MSAAAAEAHAEADEGDRIVAEGQAPASRSVIRPERKKEFRPSDLSVQLTKAVTDEKGRTDPAKLKAFAIANGLWKPEYARLNVGMQRMNVGTRLRAIHKKGGAIVWPK